MGNGLKEKALMAMAGVIVMFALAVGLWFFSAENAWKKSAKQYDRACQTYEKEERLISQRRKWNEAYEAEKAAMPLFAEGQATDTTWLRKVEELAKANNVLITQSSYGKEVEAGDVLELPIDVKNLEASLESLVKFMHALENTTEGMFDIRELSIQPNKSKKGYLKGSMAITCAYMRGE